MGRIRRPKKIEQAVVNLKIKENTKRSKSHLSSNSNLLRAKVFDKQGRVALPVNEFKAVIQSRVNGDIVKANRIVTNYLLDIGKINTRIYHEKIAIEHSKRLSDIQKETIIRIISKMVQAKYNSLKKLDNINNNKIVSETVELIKEFDFDFIYNT